MDPTPQPRKLLTETDKFRDVSRGDPRPHSLKGDALIQARLTPETWRLEIVGEGGAQVEKQRKLDDNTAIDYPTIRELGKTHGVKFFKAMQCLNIAQPLGQGVWEGVPLRDVLRLAGKIGNVRRLFYWGFHNNDPKQKFQSSLALNQALDTPPGELPPFLAYALNGEPLSLMRGGPVRMVIPWAHGFKSIKWLHRITLTNDPKANDTYADGNNDPESYLKTMARIDDGQEAFKAKDAITMRGLAVVGWPGLKRVEYWLRPDTGTHGQLAEDDPAWKSAKWEECVIQPPPSDWKGQLPADVAPGDICGFDPKTGTPKDWPMRYSFVPWSVALKGLAAGAYEFRVRSVDLNGFAQPEPRPYQKSGKNEVQCKTFMVMG